MASSHNPDILYACVAQCNVVLAHHFEDISRQRELVEAAQIILNKLYDGDDLAEAKREAHS